MDGRPRLDRRTLSRWGCPTSCVRIEYLLSRYVARMLDCCPGVSRVQQCTAYRRGEFVIERVGQNTGFVEMLPVFWRCLSVGGCSLTLSPPEMFLTQHKLEFGRQNLSLSVEISPRWIVSGGSNMNAETVGRQHQCRHIKHGN
jgi:hypothetical protein